MSLQSRRQLTVEGLESRMLLAADVATLSEAPFATEQGGGEIQACFADDVAQGIGDQRGQSKEQMWPAQIRLPAGFESEGIELGKGNEFFLGGTSWSGDLTNAGAIYKGNLRTGEGEIIVPGTGKPLAGLSYDARTDYLYAATGDTGAFGGNFSGQGVNVYDATSGALVAEIIVGDGTGKLTNDVLVTNEGVYVTDSINPVLYRIPLEEGGRLPSPPTVETIEMPDFVMGSAGLGFNANGLVGDFYGQHLVVVNINTGVLYKVDTATGDSTPIDIQGEQDTFVDGDGLYMDGRTLYIMQNFQNKIAVVQLTSDLTEGTFVKDIVSEDFSIPTTIMGYRDSIYAINTHFCELTTFCGLEPDQVEDPTQFQTEVVKLPKHSPDRLDFWPDSISLPAGFESEGIELGNGHEFFLGGTSWSGDLTNAGAIYKGNLRTGEGEIIVPGTGKPLAGLSYDARTDYLYAATGDTGAFGGNFSGQGVNVYDATSGALVAEIIVGDGTGKLTNDVLVTNEGVYVTDSINPVLYRIPLEEGGRLPSPPTVETIEMPDFVMGSAGLGFNANGLVGDFYGQHLVVVNINTGVLYKVDTATGDSTPIDIQGEQDTFVDGDGLYMDGRTLYIMQNFQNKIAVVQLTSDLSEGTFIKDIVSKDLSIPTTIMGYGDSIYAINTHFCELTTFCGLEPDQVQDPTQFQTEVVRVQKLAEDFDMDGDVDRDDVDVLVGAIVDERDAETNKKWFDLSGDGVVDATDLTRWRSAAASHNGFSEAYLLGDANLDGSVDSEDLNQLALSWRHDVALWSAGDFTADGYIDAADLNWLALNWRASIASDASP